MTNQLNKINVNQKLSNKLSNNLKSNYSAALAIRQPNHAIEVYKPLQICFLLTYAQSSVLKSKYKAIINSILISAFIKKINYQKLLYKNYLEELKKVTAKHKKKNSRRNSQDDIFVDLPKWDDILYSHASKQHDNGCDVLCELVEYYFNNTEQLSIDLERSICHLNQYYCLENNSLNDYKIKIVFFNNSLKTNTSCDNDNNNLRNDFNKLLQDCPLLVEILTKIKEERKFDNSSMRNYFKFDL